MSDNLKEHFDSILKKVDNLCTSAESLKISLKKLESEFLKPDYTQIEGVSGKFNGFEIITDTGEKIPVPQNYAAKSRLVFGDVLKKLEEDGKTIFKQVQKVDRQQVEGILTKKEGEWYLLSDRGSYKVLDTAAEFLKAQLNSEALAFIPANNTEAPFATLDKLIGTQYLVNTPFTHQQQETPVSVEIPVKKQVPPEVKIDKQPTKQPEAHRNEIKKDNEQIVKKVQKDKMFKGTAVKPKPMPRQEKPQNTTPPSPGPQQDTGEKKIDDDDLV